MIVIFQTHIDEAKSLTFGDKIYLALGHLDAVTGLLKERQDAKDATQDRFSLVEKEKTS